MSDSVTEFLAGYPAEVRDLAMKARTLILDVIPDATEQVYLGWKNIGYGVGAGMSTQLCYIAPMKDRINLGFNLGALLPDPEGMLEGTGKLLRHIKVKKADILEKPALRDLIEASLSAAIKESEKE